MDRIAGGMEALVLRIQYLEASSMCMLKLGFCSLIHFLIHPPIHSFLHSNIYVLAIREKSILLRARLMKHNKRTCLAEPF